MDLRSSRQHPLRARPIFARWRGSLTIPALHRWSDKTGAGTSQHEEAARRNGALVLLRVRIITTQAWTKVPWKSMNLWRDGFKTCWLNVLMDIGFGLLRCGNAVDASNACSRFFRLWLLVDPYPWWWGKTRNAHTYFCTTEKPIQGPCFFQWPCVLCVCVRVSVILYKVSSSVPKTITVVAAISEALEHWSPQSIFQINGGRTAFSRSREPKMFIRIKIQTLHEWTKNQKNYIQTTCTPQIAFPKSSWHSQTFTQNSSKTTPQRPSPSRPPRSWRV